MLINSLYAAGQPASGGGLVGLLPLLLIFVIFYFLLIRPQKKQQQKHRDFIANLKVGDEVVTNSGVVGKIVDLTDRFAFIEIADGVKIKLLRNYIIMYARDLQAEQKK